MEDDYDDEEEEEKIKKRNPDTDCKNTIFEQSIRERRSAPSPNYLTINKNTVQN